MNYIWVDNQSLLQQVVTQLTPNATVALDSEFIRRETYFPILGILQLNIQQQIYLIDGTMDLQPLWSALFRVKRIICHSGGEDLEIIYHLAGQKPLTNILDTQIAIHFLGYGSQVGYQKALQLFLNIDIEKDKEQTCSDWLQRPLSEQQCRYACADVQYLPALAETLLEKLQQKQLADYVLEDCRSFAATMGNNQYAQDLIADYSAHHVKNKKQYMLLQRLVEWREETAIRLNKPRNFLLKNEVVLQMIRQPPKDMYQLSHYFTLRASIVREHGKTILNLLHELPDVSQWPEIHLHPGACSREASELVQGMLSDMSRQFDIPRDCVMRKKWLKQIFMVNNGFTVEFSPYLTGWRNDLITQPLLQALTQLDTIADDEDEVE